MDIAKLIYEKKFYKNECVQRNKELVLQMREEKEIYLQAKESKEIEMTRLMAQNLIGFSKKNEVGTPKRASVSVLGGLSKNRESIVKKESAMRKQVDRLTAEFKMCEADCIRRQKENFAKINEVDKAIKALKKTYYELAKQQKLYYINLLKAGIDVRMEGISWVVKRLMELRAVVEVTHFPRFLDSSQINYILDISKREIKINQKKIQIKSLKEKQKINKRNQLSPHKSGSRNDRFSRDFFSPEASKTEFRQTAYRTHDFEQKNFHKDFSTENIEKVMFGSRLGLTNTELSFNTNTLLNNLESSFSVTNKTITNKKMEEETINDLVKKIKEDKEEVSL